MQFLNEFQRLDLQNVDIHMHAHICTCILGTFFSNQGSTTFFFLKLSKQFAGLDPSSSADWVGAV